MIGSWRDGLKILDSQAAECRTMIRELLLEACGDHFCPVVRSTEPPLYIARHESRRDANNSSIFVNPALFWQEVQNLESLIAQ